MQGNEFDFLIEHFRNANLESFRHEPFIFPTQLTTSLAYFLGACAGDGTLNPHQVRIIDGHQEYMQRLHSITRNLTATNVDLSRFKGAKAWLLILKSKWFARLIYFLTSQPFGRKYESLTVPKIFQELSNKKELENRYCQGLFDTDGTYDKNAKSVWFGSSSRKLIQDVSTILERRMIHHTVYQTNSHFWNLFVKRSGLVQYAKEIGLISPSKQQGLCRSLEVDPYRHEFFGVNRSTIVDQSNYLDFQLLPRLLISDGYYLLKEFLDQINDNEQEILKLYSKQRDSWCRSKRVPFNVLYQLGNSLGVKIYAELEKRKAHYVYPYGKYTIRLPAMISDQLLAIMAYFTPFNHGLVVTTGIGRELDRKNVKEVIDLAADLFEISPTSFQRNNDYSFKIANELLRDYAQTFFIYQKPWKAISKREITALLAGWNKIIEN